MFENIETIFLVEHLTHLKNGICNSIIRKMKLFEDEWDYKTVMFIPTHNLEMNNFVGFLKYVEHSEQEVRLNKNARIINMYEELQKTNLEDDNLMVTEYKRGEDGLEYKEIGHNIYDVYDSGFKVRTEYYTGAFNRLRLVVRWDGNGIRTKRIYYDDNGNINLIQIIDPKNQEYVPLEYYYTVDKKLCLKIENKFNKIYDMLHPQNEIEKITLYDDDGSVLKEFKTNQELTSYWLDKYTSDTKKTYLIIEEAGIYATALAKLDKPNVIRASMVHAAFLDNPYNLDSPPQPYYEQLCSLHESFEGIIFLTEKERLDFIKRYGDRHNTFTIAHPYLSEIVEAGFEERNHKKAVFIARFDSVKRIDWAIEIFKKVIDVLPDVKLEIYGFGQEHEAIKSLIRRLDIESNVIIMGYTKNPAEVFQGAAISLMTSRSEGFGITLVESVCNGCPVASFDLKYGPSDVIKDGETGFLVPMDSKEIFAEKLIEFFGNIDMQRQFSENCYRDSERFTKKTFLRKWQRFITAMERNNNK